MSEITYRWIDGHSATQEEWDAIDLKLAARGWMSLNRELTRIRVAEHDGKIVAMFVLQHIPHIEPLLVDRRYQGTGVTDQLINDMQDFLAEVKARGFMAVCESPIAKKFCEDRGMVQVPHPVYVSVPEEVK
jgi:GNAT superfamily N-acetyltransferase